MTRLVRTLTCLAVVLLGTTPALASGPPEAVTLPPRVFTEVNPCTGEPHVVTLALTLRLHEFELADPARHHLSSTLTGTIVTSSAFTGRVTQVDVDNGAGLFDEGEGGTATFVTNGMATNGSGGAFAVHVVSHITLVDAEPVVVVDRFSLECLR